MDAKTILPKISTMTTMVCKMQTMLVHAPVILLLDQPGFRIQQLTPMVMAVEIRMKTWTMTTMALRTLQTIVLRLSEHPVSVQTDALIPMVTSGRIQPMIVRLRRVIQPKAD